VWYSSPRDAALRNVVAALRLLNESPAAEPDPLRRWDTTNALLQALQQRWAARAGVKPADVKQVIEDIDATILTAEQTFAAMESLTRKAGLSEDLWAARRNALEKTLIRPVKAYRSDALPHLHKKEVKPEADEELEPERSAIGLGAFDDATVPRSAKIDIPTIGEPAGVDPELE
jgi:hypothetical protein